MSKRNLLILLVILLLGFTGLLRADNVFVEEQVYYAQIFQSFRYHYGREEYPQALEELQKIAEKYPNTEYEANARLLLAGLYVENFSDPQKALPEYQKLRERFPNTRYDLIARASSLQLRTPHPRDFLAKLDRMILESGGKSCRAIIAAGTKDESFDRQAVPKPYRGALTRFYSWAAQDYRENRQLMAAWKILLFVRENFPQEGGPDVLEPIAEDLLEARNITDFTPYQTLPPAPRCGIVYPPDGYWLSNDGPRIEFELKAGDIQGPRIDLARVVFTLDGLDLTPKMKIKSQLNTSARPGVPFEILRIYYLPASPLAPGKHEIKVKAYDSQDGECALNWNFFVRP